MRTAIHSPFVFAILSLIPACAGGDTEAATSDVGLFINEFVAANATGLQDEGGAFPDWIEVWNSTDETVELTGWTLTDDLTEPTKWAFADASRIEAGGYVVVMADGDTLEGPLHASFRLDAEVGEDVGLFDPDGASADALTYEPQRGDTSQARTPDGSDDWEPDPTPTPGAANQ